MAGHRRLAGLALAALALAVPAVALAGKAQDGLYEGRGTNVGNAALDQVADEIKVTGDGGKVKNWTVRA